MMSLAAHPGEALTSAGPSEAVWLWLPRSAWPHGPPVPEFRQHGARGFPPGSSPPAERLQARHLVPPSRRSPPVRSAACAVSLAMSAPSGRLLSRSPWPPVRYLAAASPAPCGAGPCLRTEVRVQGGGSIPSWALSPPRTLPVAWPRCCHLSIRSWPCPSSASNRHLSAATRSAGGADFQRLPATGFPPGGLSAEPFGSESRDSWAAPAVVFPAVRCPVPLDTMTPAWASTTFHYCVRRIR